MTPRRGTHRRCYVARAALGSSPPRACRWSSGRWPAAAEAAAEAAEVARGEPRPSTGPTTLAAGWLPRLRVARGVSRPARLTRESSRGRVFSVFCADAKGISLDAGRAAFTSCCLICAELGMLEEVAEVVPRSTACVLPRRGTGEETSSRMMTSGIGASSAGLAAPDA